MPTYPEIIEHEQILTSVKQHLRLSNSTDNDIFLLSLIDRASRSINSTETNIVKSSTLEVDNNNFGLPGDAKKLIAFRINGNCISGIFIDIPFFASCNCKASGFPSIYSAIKVNGRTAHFLTTVPNETEFEVAYTTVNRDGKGRMITSEEQAEACINYTCWQAGLTFIERYTPEQRAEWKKRWLLQAGMVRSAAANRTFGYQKEQIESTMNAIIFFNKPFTWLGSLFPNTFYYATNP